MRKWSLALSALALVIALSFGSLASATSWQTVETWTDSLEAAEWQTVETWTDNLNTPPPSWQTVETWADYMTAPWVPPGLSDEDVWALFALRILFMFGPLGFVAWEFTQVRGPVTGVRAAVWISVTFIALIILWVVADAIELMLYSV